MPSSTLPDSTAAVIRQLLVDKGVGVMGGTPVTGDWPVYTSSEPDAPDNCITVYDTAGTDDGRSMIDGELFSHNGFQVRVRSTTHQVGWRKADEIQTVLAQEVYYDVVTVGANQYLVNCVAHIGDPIPLGKETPTSKRNLFTLNATMAGGLYVAPPPPPPPPPPPMATVTKTTVGQQTFEALGIPYHTDLVIEAKTGGGGGGSAVGSPGAPSGGGGGGGGHASVSIAAADCDHSGTVNLTARGLGHDTGGDGTEGSRPVTSYRTSGNSLRIITIHGGRGGVSGITGGAGGVGGGDVELSGPAGVVLSQTLGSDGQNGLTGGGPNNGGHGGAGYDGAAGGAGGTGVGVPGADGAAIGGGGGGASGEWDESGDGQVGWVSISWILP